MVELSFVRIFETNRRKPFKALKLIHALFMVTISKKPIGESLLRHWNDNNRCRPRCRCRKPIGESLLRHWNVQLSRCVFSLSQETNRRKPFKALKHPAIANDGKLAILKPIGESLLRHWNVYCQVFFDTVLTETNRRKPFKALKRLSAVSPTIGINGNQ